MMLHPIINELAKRRQTIDDAIKNGSINFGKAIDNYAWLAQKDFDGSPVVGVSRSQSVDLASSNDDYISFTVTTFDEDRDGDVVIPTGIDLTNYSRNPLWFFGHQENPIPIGTSRSPDGRICVFPEENRCKAWWFPDKPDPDAMFIAGKVRRGILNATSIAFVPIEAYRRDDVHKAHQHEGGPGGWVFKRIDLTEISIVGVPSNAGAIRDALDSEKSFIRPRLQKALAVYAAKSRSEQGGGCWNGWCPAPTKQETTVSKQVKKSCGCTTKAYGCATRKAGDASEVKKSVVKALAPARVAQVFRQIMDKGGRKVGDVIETLRIRFKTAEGGIITTPSYDEIKAAILAGGEKLKSLNAGTQLDIEHADGAGTVDVTKGDLPGGYSVGDKVLIWPSGGRKQWEATVVGVDSLGNLKVQPIKGGIAQIVPLEWIDQRGRKSLSIDITKDALADCVSRKVPIFAREHPDWSQDRCVAAAYGWCGEKKGLSVAVVKAVLGSPREFVKPLSESSGAAGGYAVPTEQKAEGFKVGDKVTSPRMSMGTVGTIEGLNQGDYKVRWPSGKFSWMPASDLVKKSLHCTFCKGTGNGCGRRGDCPDCGGRGVVKRLVRKFGAPYVCPNCDETFTVDREAVRSPICPRCGAKVFKGKKMTSIRKANNWTVVMADGSAQLGINARTSDEAQKIAERIARNQGAAGDAARALSAKDNGPYTRTTKTKNLENDDAEAKGEDEGMAHVDTLPHEVAMAHLYNHAKGEMDYITEALEGVTPFDAQTGEANKAHGALKEYGETVGQRMESLKSMFADHTEGKDIDEAVEGLETTGDGNEEIGEANLVDRGEVPDIEAALDEETTMDLDDGIEQTMDVGDEVEMDLPPDTETQYEEPVMDLGNELGVGGDVVDEPTEEILERYETAKAVSKADLKRGDRVVVAPGPGEGIEGTIVNVTAGGFTVKDTNGDTDVFSANKLRKKSFKSRPATAARVAKVLSAGGAVKKGADGRRWLVAKRQQVRKGRGDALIGLEIKVPGGKMSKVVDIDGNYAVTESGHRVSFDSLKVKSIKQRRKSATDTTDYPHGDDGNLKNEGNPAELKAEHAEVAKAAGCMMKGMSVAHDLPEHHKSALDMHGDALQKAADGEHEEPVKAMTKAMEHAESLSDAPDVPEHHKDALNFHAKAMKKALKAMGAETPEEDKDLTDEGNPAELKADQEETKRLFADLNRSLGSLNDVRARTLDKMNGRN